jgi:hypothetical protein
VSPGSVGGRQFELSVVELLLRAVPGAVTAGRGLGGTKGLGVSGRVVQVGCAGSSSWFVGGRSWVGLEWRRSGWGVVVGGWLFEGVGFPLIGLGSWWWVAIAGAVDRMSRSPWVGLLELGCGG